MKKIIISTAIFALATTFANAEVFDSMDSAVEVKLAPAISTPQTNSAKTEEVSVYTNTSLQTQKFNSALTNLDDALVELRQDLAQTTEKYNAALVEKQTAIQNCKAIKKEINAINKKMKNIDKSKKIINKNLETAK